MLVLRLGRKKIDGDKMNKIFFMLIAMGSLLIGCSCPTRSQNLRDPIELEGAESKNSTFFATNSNFEFSPETISQIHKLLKSSKSKGVGNVGFMCISNSPVGESKQEAVKKQIYAIICANGFIKSRITNSGFCNYASAQNGVRIDILKYKLDMPNCDPWDTGIGDVDVHKSIPKHGASSAYNLSQMIANKADIVSPRKYNGQQASAAIGAISGGSSGGSSSSGVVAK